MRLNNHISIAASCFPEILMECRLLLFLPLLVCLVVGGSHASGAGEKYWHAVLPKTPFPKALQHLFEPNSESKTVVDKNNDGMVTDGRQKLEILKDIDDPPSSTGFSTILKDASVAYGKPMHSKQENLQDEDSVPSKDLSETTKDATIIYGKPRNSKKMNLLHVDLPSYEDFSKIMKDASIAYEKTRNSEQTLPDDVSLSKYLLKFLKDLYDDSQQSSTLQYDDSAPSKSVSETVKDLSIIYEMPRSGSKMNKGIDLPEAKQPVKNAIGDRTIFYMYNDLHPGKKMTLLFTNGGNKVDFLPRQVAEAMPFSTDKVPEILNRFSIDPESADAEVIKDTIGDCENHQREEVFKHCATSVESLVDQNVARLRRNIRVLSTPEGKRQEYTVLAGTKKIADDRVIVCHRERYPYAVYYCHEINDTEVYTVPLMGADGTKLKAVTICHKDTSAWNPDYIAFQTLKTEPGQPFCHFLSSDALVWFQTKELGHDTLAYVQNILNQGAFDI